MRVVIQRVKSSQVEVNGEVLGRRASASGLRVSAGDPRVARTASEASGLALLTSSGLDRAPGSGASRAIGGSAADDDLPRLFPPESAVFAVHNRVDGRISDAGGTGRGRLSTAGAVGFLHLRVL